MIKKYTKKTITVEAIQFTLENKNQAYHWARSHQMNVEATTDDKGDPILTIPTLEGVMTCSIGDYLIKEPFPTDWRKIYPCKEEIFKQTYEEEE